VLHGFDDGVLDAEIALDAMLVPGAVLAGLPTITASTSAAYSMARIKGPASSRKRPSRRK